MAGKGPAESNGPEDRRRNPSRPIKGAVSDIREAFQNASPKPVQKKQANKPKPRKPKEKQEKNAKVSKNSLTDSPVEETDETFAEGDSNFNENDQHVNNIHVHTHESDTQNNNSIEKLQLEDEASNTSNARTNAVETTKEMPDQTSLKQLDSNEEEATPQTSKQNEAAKISQDNSAVLQALNEIKGSLTKLENTIFDPKNGIEAQLGKTISRVDDIYTEIHGAVGGLKVRMDQAETNIATSTTKLSTLESNLSRLAKMIDESKRISSDLAVMQGIIQKTHNQSQILNHKVTDLTKRGMEQNLLIHGIDEPVDPRARENCKQVVQRFLLENIEVDIHSNDIWKAHRSGQRRVGAVRPMIIKVAYHVKESIMENVGKLKGLTNRTTGKPLFISEQVPEGVVETKKQISSRLKVLRDQNEELPPERKKKITVQNDKIVVNGDIDTPEITTPQPSDLFMSQEELTQVHEQDSNMVMAEPVLAKHSQFIGLATAVKSIEDIRIAYKAVALRFPSMDHIMMAYGVKDGQVKWGHCDDFEFGGGSCVRRAMSSQKMKDTAVFVVRKYGGLHMGMDRFKSIEEAANRAIRLLKDKY